MTGVNKFDRSNIVILFSIVLNRWLTTALTIVEAWDKHTNK